MKIRELTWKALPAWPPEWLISDEGAGEKGVLEDVQFRGDLNPRLITIVANHQGETRKGVMVLEDPVHLEILFHNLKDNIGKALTEIGNLNIDFSFPLKKKGQKQIRPNVIARKKYVAQNNR